jgi:hypothetical protein
MSHGSKPLHVMTRAQNDRLEKRRQAVSRHEAGRADTWPAIGL